MEIKKMMTRDGNELFEAFMLNCYKSYLNKEDGYWDLCDHRNSIPSTKVKNLSYTQSVYLNKLYEENKINFWEYAKKCDYAFRVKALKKALEKYPDKKENILEFYHLQLVIGDDYVDIRFKMSI